MAFLKSVFAGLVILAVAMLAKPLLVRALQANAGAAPLPPMPRGTARLPAGAGPMAMPGFDPRRPAAAKAPAREEPEDLLDAVINVRHIEGRINAASSRRLAELLQRHPDLAAQAVRRWLAQGNDRS
jgi:flagellar M-ring protein FliF